MFQMWLFTICPVQQILSNVMKIRAEINTLQKNQHFTFCSFTVLNKLKALQLSKVGLSTVEINTVKIWHHMAEPLEEKHIRMQTACKTLFIKGDQNVHHSCTDTCLEMLLRWYIAVLIMFYQISDHTAVTQLQYGPISQLNWVNSTQLNWQLKMKIW